MQNEKQLLHTLVGFVWTIVLLAYVMFVFKWLNRQRQATQPPDIPPARHPNRRERRAWARACHTKRCNRSTTHNRTVRFIGLTRFRWLNRSIAFARSPTRRDRLQKARARCATQRSEAQAPAGGVIHLRLTESPATPQHNQRRVLAFGCFYLIFLAGLLLLRAGDVHPNPGPPKFTANSAFAAPPPANNGVNDDDDNTNSSNNNNVIARLQWMSAQALYFHREAPEYVDGDYEYNVHESDPVAYSHVFARLLWAVCILKPEGKKCAAWQWNKATSSGESFNVGLVSASLSLLLGHTQRWGPEISRAVADNHIEFTKGKGNPQSHFSFTRNFIEKIVADLEPPLNQAARSMNLMILHLSRAQQQHFVSEPFNSCLRQLVTTTIVEPCKEGIRARLSFQQQQSEQQEQHINTAPNEAADRVRDALILKINGALPPQEAHDREENDAVRLRRRAVQLAAALFTELQLRQWLARLTDCPPVPEAVRCVTWNVGGLSKVAPDAITTLINNPESIKEDVLRNTVKVTYLNLVALLLVVEPHCVLLQETGGWAAGADNNTQPLWGFFDSLGYASVFGVPPALRINAKGAGCGVLVRKPAPGMGVEINVQSVLPGQSTRTIRDKPGQTVTRSSYDFGATGENVPLQCMIVEATVVQKHQHQHQHQPLTVRFASVYVQAVHGGNWSTQWATDVGSHMLALLDDFGQCDFIGGDFNAHFSDSSDGALARRARTFLNVLTAAVSTTDNFDPQFVLPEEATSRSLTGHIIDGFAHNAAVTPTVDPESRPAAFVLQLFTRGVVATTQAVAADSSTAAQPQQVTDHNAVVTDFVLPEVKNATWVDCNGKLAKFGKRSIPNLRRMIHIDYSLKLIKSNVVYRRKFEHRTVAYAMRVFGDRRRHMATISVDALYAWLTSGAHRVMRKAGAASGFRPPLGAFCSITQRLLRERREAYMRCRTKRAEQRRGQEDNDDSDDEQHADNNNASDHEDEEVAVENAADFKKLVGGGDVLYDQREADLQAKQLKIPPPVRFLRKNDEEPLVMGEDAARLAVEHILRHEAGEPEEISKSTRVAKQANSQQQHRQRRDPEQRLRQQQHRSNRNFQRNAAERTINNFIDSTAESLKDTKIASVADEERLRAETVNGAMVAVDAHRQQLRQQRHQQQQTLLSNAAVVTVPVAAAASTAAPAAATSQRRRTKVPPPRLDPDKDCFSKRPNDFGVFNITEQKVLELIMSRKLVGVDVDGFNSKAFKYLSRTSWHFRHALATLLRRILGQPVRFDPKTGKASTVPCKADLRSICPIQLREDNTRIFMKPRDGGSYLVGNIRTINAMSHVRWLIERVWFDTMYEFLDIHPSLFSVCGRSAEQALATLSMVVSESKRLVVRNTGGFPFFIKMDIVDFYGTIPHRRLVECFRKCAKPDAADHPVFQRLLRFLEEYLTDRIFRVQLNEQDGSGWYKSGNRGLPAGTLVADLCATVYMCCFLAHQQQAVADVQAMCVKVFRDTAVQAAYRDDVGFIFAAADRDVAVKCARLYLDLALNFARPDGIAFKIAAHALLNSVGANEPRAAFGGTPINLAGGVVQISLDPVDFLGLIFDGDWRFKHHLNKVVPQAVSVLRRNVSIIRRRRSVKAAFNFIRRHILPIVFYAAVVWWSMMWRYVQRRASTSATAKGEAAVLQRLEIFVARCCKVAGGMLRESAPDMARMMLFGFTSVKDYLNNLCFNFAQGALRLPLVHPLRRALELPARQCSNLRLATSQPGSPADFVHPERRHPALVAPSTVAVFGNKDLKQARISYSSCTPCNEYSDPAHTPLCAPPASTSPLPTLPMEHDAKNCPKLREYLTRGTKIQQNYKAAAAIEANNNTNKWRQLLQAKFSVTTRYSPDGVRKMKKDLQTLRRKLEAIQQLEQLEVAAKRTHLQSCIQDATFALQEWLDDEIDELRKQGVQHFFFPDGSYDRRSDSAAAAFVHIDYSSGKRVVTTHSVCLGAGHDSFSAECIAYAAILDFIATDQRLRDQLAGSPNPRVAILPDCQAAVQIVGRAAPPRHPHSEQLLLRDKLIPALCITNIIQVQAPSHIDGPDGGNFIADREAARVRDRFVQLPPDARRALVGNLVTAGAQPVPVQWLNASSAPGINSSRVLPWQAVLTALYPAMRHPEAPGMAQQTADTPSDVFRTSNKDIVEFEQQLLQEHRQRRGPGPGQESAELQRMIRSCKADDDFVNAKYKNNRNDLDRYTNTVGIVRAGLDERTTPWNSAEAVLAFERGLARLQGEEYRLVKVTQRQGILIDAAVTEHPVSDEFGFRGCLNLRRVLLINKRAAEQDEQVSRKRAFREINDKYGTAIPINSQKESVTCDDFDVRICELVWEKLPRNVGATLCRIVSLVHWAFGGDWHSAGDKRPCPFCGASLSIPNSEQQQQNRQWAQQRRNGNPAAAATPPHPHPFSHFLTCRSRLLDKLRECFISGNIDLDTLNEMRKAIEDGNLGKMLAEDKEESHPLRWTDFFPTINSLDRDISESRGFLVSITDSTAASKTSNNRRKTRRRKMVGCGGNDDDWIDELLEDAEYQPQEHDSPSEAQLRLAQFHMLRRTWMLHFMVKFAIDVERAERQQRNVPASPPPPAVLIESDSDLDDDDRAAQKSKKKPRARKQQHKGASTGDDALDAVADMFRQGGDEDDQGGGAANVGLGNDGAAPVAQSAPAATVQQQPQQQQAPAPAGKKQQKPKGKGGNK